jgi:hypothetical protein
MARGVADPDLDPFFFRLGETKTLEPDRARRAAAGRIDHEIGRDAVPGAAADPGAHPLIVALLSSAISSCTAQLSITRTFDKAIRRRRTWPSSTGRGASNPTRSLGGRFDGDAMADPVHVAGDIAAGAAAGDDLVGPAREEILDHVAAARQQAMRMAALRYALARNVRLRKRVALQHGDDGEEIRQRPRGQRPPMLAPITMAC